jgi:hypothetical protein
VKILKFFGADPGWKKLGSVDASMPNVVRDGGQMWNKVTFSHVFYENIKYSKIPVVIPLMIGPFCTVLRIRIRDPVPF